MIKILDFTMILVVLLVAPLQLLLYQLHLLLHLETSQGQLLHLWALLQLAEQHLWELS